MNKIKDELIKCTTREEVTRVFESYNIMNLSKRIDMLNEIMHTQAPFYPDDIKYETRYARELSAFIIGNWKPEAALKELQEFHDERKKQVSRLRYLFLLIGSYINGLYNKFISMFKK